MQKRLYFLIIIAFTFSHCANNQNNITDGTTDSILKIEMRLSAFGVESDDFPSIDADIDFVNDSSRCRKWFYNPAFKDSTYSLSKNEIENILKILTNSDLTKLKKEYTVSKSDQPRSIITIYTSKQKFIINDYGLEGEYPLQKLYDIVYKF